ncbi:MAG: response regulator [Limisphaerales bacterium]
MKTKTRILLVDDNLALLDVISKLLRSEGHEVCTAPTGLEGLWLTRQWLPDLVLLDVRLPDLDGFEVCRQIKSDPALVDVFVIMLSGEATSASQKAGGLDTGADEYLTKPLDAEELFARIRTAARLRHTTAALRASEQHYRRLVEILPDAVGQLDEQGRLAAVNPQAASMLGYAEAGLLLGKSAFELAPPEEQARFRADLALALRTGVLHNVQYTLLRKNGRRFPAEISAAVSSEGRGQPSGLVLVVRDITERKRTEEDLRQLPRRIIEAQEAERLRVARELHDGVNQILASAKMRLRKAEDSLAAINPAATQMLARCYELMVQALEENRRIAHALRPSELDELGLAEACRNLCKDLEARSNLRVSCQITAPAKRLPPAVELNLFRIIQETLSNIEQHAHAATVSLQMTVQDGFLQLSIRDDGRGFGPKGPRPSKDKRRGIGLTNVRERAAALGGVCEIKSAPKQGTLIRVRVPV